MFTEAKHKQEVDSAEDYHVHIHKRRRNYKNGDIATDIREEYVEAKGPQAITLNWEGTEGVKSNNQFKSADPNNQGQNKTTRRSHRQR